MKIKCPLCWCQHNGTQGKKCQLDYLDPNTEYHIMPCGFREDLMGVVSAKWNALNQINCACEELTMGSILPVNGIDVLSKEIGILLKEASVKTMKLLDAYGARVNEIMKETNNDKGKQK